MPLTHFCPHCWQEIAGAEAVCPHCGYELAKDTELTYAEKLLTALDHPVPAQRLLAIQLLGDLRSQAAVPALSRMLADEGRDVYELLEALVALSKIPGHQSRDLIRLACQHPYPLVGRMAARLMESQDRSAS